MHHNDDIMMTKALMKSLEIRPIEFASFLEKNVVATCNNSEIRLLTCSIQSYECGSSEC